MMINGDQDIIANPAYSLTLAKKLNVVANDRMFFLEGAHFINRERADDVNRLLHAFILESCVSHDHIKGHETLYIKNLDDKRK